MNKNRNKNKNKNSYKNTHKEASKNPFRNIAGFSLLEVIVALAVAAIALIGLTNSLTSYANSFVLLGDRLRVQPIIVNELSRRSLERSYIIPEFIEINNQRVELILQEEDYLLRDMEGLVKLKLTAYDAQQREIMQITTISTK